MYKYFVYRVFRVPKMKMHIRHEIYRVISCSCIFVFRVLESETRIRPLLISCTQFETRIRSETFRIFFVYFSCILYFKYINIILIKK